MILKKRKTSLKKVDILSSDIISILVHDINNLLGIIKGYFDRALMDEEKLPKGLAESLPIGLRATEDLSRLVLNLADIAKIEENILKLYPERTDMNELVRSAIAKTKVAAQDADIVLSAGLGKAPVIFNVDKGLIFRTIISLIASAIKSTAPGGRIRVSAGLSGNILKISFEDTGLWIPPQYRKKIFEKYAQAEIKEANLRRGRGLNLVFCKLAVEAHGGRIWMDSDRSHKKSTVVFTIPRKK